MRFRRVACRPRLRPRFPAGIMPHGGKGFGTIRRLYARGHLHHLRNRQLRPLLRRPPAAVLGPSSLPAAMVLSVLLDAHRSCGAAAGKLPRTGRRRLAPRGSGAAFRAEPRGGRPPCWEALPDEPVYPLRRRRPRSRASATPASLKHGRTEPAFRPAVAQSAKLATPPLPVEHAARLAMPAVAPAEPHTPQQSGLPKCHPPPRLAAWPARLRAPPQAAAPFSTQSRVGADRRVRPRQGRNAGRRARERKQTPAASAATAKPQCPTCPTGSRNRTAPAGSGLP